MPVKLDYLPEMVEAAYEEACRQLKEENVENEDNTTTLCAVVNQLGEALCLLLHRDLIGKNVQGRIYRPDSSTMLVHSGALITREIINTCVAAGVHKIPTST
jgi:hypothetical protein